MNDHTDELMDKLARLFVGGGMVDDVTINDYLLYVITITLILSLMFAFNSMMFSDLILGMNVHMADYKTLLILFSIIVLVVVDVPPSIGCNVYSGIFRPALANMVSKSETVACPPIIKF